MKGHIVTVSVIISALMFFSCGKSGGDTLPRGMYASSVEGVVLRSAPDEKSRGVALVPLGWKFTITEESAQQGGAKWYKTDWEKKAGWVSGESVSERGGFFEQLIKIIASDQGFITGGSGKSFNISTTDKITRYTYTGGEMEPASMMFLPGGGMVLNSKIFDEKYTNHYFTCEFLNEGRLLKLAFADNRLNFADYYEVENGSASVFKIDRNEGSITYHVKNGAFYFMNWGFVRDDKF